MNLAVDFLDLLRSLNDAGADYLLVGGYAVNAYGHVRATEDLDVWVRASEDNAVRVLRALDDFGMPPGLDPTVFQSVQGTPPTGFRFGRRPVSVDLLTSIQGVRFDDAWAARESLQLDGIEVSLIGRDHLIQAKRACGRPKDLADIAALTQG
jgi:predicted nucleotidyltransferase